jgi:2,4-dienoyl-CoA reductase-like NADH-dependent reductase (Old Yellow Enzyme family)
MKAAGIDRRTFIRKSVAATAGFALGYATRGVADTGQGRAVADVNIDALFTPFAIGPYQAKNRFVMAPMAVGNYHEGVPTAEVADHYERRAKGGAGLLITGGTIVDHPRGSAETNIGRMNARSQETWKRITEKVHAHQAGIFCQLWHQGPLTEPGIGPRAMVEDGRTVVSVAFPSDLTSVIDSFVRSARLARGAGFDGVEIHGAHGYLLDAYLRAFGTRAVATTEVSPETFVYQLVKEVRAAVGPRFPLGFRFSRWSNDEYSGNYLADPTRLQDVLLPLKQAGVDVFHASRGYGPFWLPEYKESSLSLAGWCRRTTAMPTITVGHVGLEPRQFFSRNEGGLATLMSQFAEGQFDLVAVGRALLKNPDWVNMVQRKEYAALIAVGPAD